MATAPVRPSTRRGPREDRDAARRERLLATGLQVFGTVGYARSAIETICAEAGVGTRSFYDLFASKEDLLVAVYEEVVGALAARIATALDHDHDDVETHVRAGVQATIDQVTADERAARVQVLECIGVSERMERRRRAVMHEIAAGLVADARRQAERGLPVRPLSPLAAVALVGGANELFADWLLDADPPSPARLVDELTALWLAVLQPGVPTP